MNYININRELLRGADEIEIANLELELTRVDIASQNDMEAVVNAANAELPVHFTEVLVRSLRRHLESLLQSNPRSSNYRMDKPEAELLAECYQNSLKLAEDSKNYKICIIQH